MTILYIILAVVVILSIYVVFTFNNLVSSRNRKDEAWSDIEVQLKRRYDLIPNLIDTVKGYVKHEEGVFTKVTELRTSLVNQTDIKSRAEGENILTDTLKSIFAVSENYPDLKANQNFISLQNELTDTENKIQASRRFYNSTVVDLNNLIQSFPSNAISNIFHFMEAEFFDLDEDESEKVKDPVKVNF